MNGAWILTTTPNYFGFEAINPLTVCFCYQKDCPELCVVVLEVSVIRGTKQFGELPHGSVNVMSIFLMWAKLRSL
jgi:hypothetical protein